MQRRLRGILIPSLLEHGAVLVAHGVKVLQMIVHGCGVGLAKIKLGNSSALVQAIHLLNATIQN